MKWRKVMFKKIRNTIYVHFDIPTLVTFLLIGCFVYRPLVSWLKKIDIGLTGDESTRCFIDFTVGLIANVVAALLLGLIIFMVYRIRTKVALCGKFKAYNVINGNNELWGEITLTYNIFSTRIKGILVSETNSATIGIDAVFERGQYLRGHIQHRLNNPGQGQRLS